MLPLQLWELLLTHKCHIIALGDPAQLPPIDPKSDNHILDKPHIFLSEIMRQAAESEIIRLTMAIREGKNIEYYKGKEVQIIPYDQVISGMYDWADQIICATNRKRLEINNYMREAANRGPHPETGDKIICLRNHWDTVDLSGENALVNGAIGTLGEFSIVKQQWPLYGVPDTPILYGKFLSDGDGVFEDLHIDLTALETGKPFLSNEQSYRVYRNAATRPLEPLEFNYGYAITCHKAQGSQWDKVLVFEEAFPFNKEEHQRWLYTACTRPSQKLVLVR
jgi:exodeoxyribonuclease-5